MAAKKKKKKKAARKRASKKKRANPQILSIVNPDALMVKAKRNYERFHGVKVKKVTRHGDGSKPLIVLGRVVEIVYEPRVGVRKKIHWFHKFGKHARLATNVEGTELHILTAKGTIQVDFDRGIVS